MSNQNKKTNKNGSRSSEISSKEEIRGRTNINFDIPMLHTNNLDKDASSDNQSEKFILDKKLIDNDINSKNINKKSSQNENNDSIKKANKESENLIGANVSPIKKNSSTEGLNDLFDINNNSQKEGIKEYKKNEVYSELSHQKDKKIDDLIQAIGTNSDLTSKLLESMQKSDEKTSKLLESIQSQMILLVKSVNNQDATLSLLTKLVNKIVEDKDNAGGVNIDGNKKKKNEYEKM